MFSQLSVIVSDEVYVDKEFLLLIHYLFWVCTCEGSYSNQILWETEELLLLATSRQEEGM